MWQTVIPRLDAATAPASVEFTSPATMTSSGPSSVNKRSSYERVVVLARVDEPLVDVAALLERGVDGCHLHVVRARADDMGDERSAGHSEESRSALDEHFWL